MWGVYDANFVKMHLFDDTMIEYLIYCGHKTDIEILIIVLPIVIKDAQWGRLFCINARNLFTSV